MSSLISRQFQRDKLPGRYFLEHERRVFRVRSKPGADRQDRENVEQREISGAIVEDALFVLRGSADDLDNQGDAQPKSNVKV